MSRVVRCTCRSHCLTFNSESQSYEGDGELVSKSTAANHRQDDLLSRTLDTFTEHVATQVLGYSPPPGSLDHRPPNPRFRDQGTTPHGFHGQPPLDDFYFALEAEAAYRCTWAPMNHSLVFVSDPPPTLSYRRPSGPEIHTSNREPYALHPHNLSNKAYLENESRLHEMLTALKRRPLSDVRDCLLARVYEGLAMMDRHKETEWNRQRTGSIARHHGYSVVDTGPHDMLLSWNTPLTQEPNIRCLFQEFTP
jgi:hypothetical protein